MTRKWIYMNHAGIAPISRRVNRSVNSLLKDVAQNGMAGASKWQKVYSRTRTLAARLIGAHPSEIAFLKNTTDGILMVANGLPWRRGDNVVIADREFPSNVYPWLSLESRGVETRRVPEMNGRIPTNRLLEAVDEHTRLLSISSVQFVSGFRHDLDAIGDFCGQRGVLFFVDAIQSLGVMRFNAAAAGIDFASADGHKWLLGLEGASVFFCSRRAMDHLRIDLGWANVVNPMDFLSYDTTPLPDARRFESGTLNTAGIYGLKACLELIDEVGVEEIEQRVFLLTDRLCLGLEEKGFQVISSRRPDEKSGIVTAHHPGFSAEVLLERLHDRGVVATVRGDCLRFSPHYYNKVEEVDTVLDVLP